MKLPNDTKEMFKNLAHTGCRRSVRYTTVNVVKRQLWGHEQLQTFDELPQRCFILLEGQI